MPHLSPISGSTGELTTSTATLTVPTPGEGFVDITADVAAFVRAAGAGTGVLFLFIRHMKRLATKMTVEGERLQYEEGIFSKSTRTLEIAKAVAVATTAGATSIVGGGD